jgi:uncharacterized membrane protein YfcA
VLPIPDLTLAGWALVAAGAFAGGFVNGLTGFGTALSSMPFWLQALPPVLAAELSAGMGVAAQLATLRRIIHAIDWRALAPLLLSGLAGVPFGAALLTFIDPVLFKRAVGLILVVYATCLLLAAGRIKLADRGVPGDIVLGFVSGVLGGLAGLSGVLPTIWAALVGWSKERRRGTFQAFNLVILAAMLIVHLIKGVVPATFWGTFLLLMPVAFIGVALGQRLYARLDDRRFDRVVLWLLGIGGVLLLMTSAR